MLSDRSSTGDCERFPEKSRGVILTDFVIFCTLWPHIQKLPHGNCSCPLVDLSIARWYHCISRCVRQALLLGDGPINRKAWIENRLEELAQIFAVTVGGFAVRDNHLHVLARLDPDAAAGWSDENVVRRWVRLYPPRDKTRRVLPVSDLWVQDRLGHPAWVATARQQLKSLSWFMKCLKEPLARGKSPGQNARGVFRGTLPEYRRPR